MNNNQLYCDMKHLHYLFICLLLSACCYGTTKSGSRNTTDSVPEITPSEATIDTFTYNLPCRVIRINPQKEGKALLFLWLHGGVHDFKSHSYNKETNHWNNCAADDSIIHYLQSKNIKAIALLPMCHKADKNSCVAWSDCYDDVHQMIEEYVVNGLVDPERIYVAGASDGGRGTWDYVAEHPELFAAAISLSCSEPRVTRVPIYFFNTASETDCTQLVNKLKQQGSNILRYQYCPQFKHGGDAAMCDKELLDEFFSHKRTQ